MPPAPLSASVLTGIVGLLGLTHIALDPTPYSSTGAVLAAGGMSVLTLVVIAGVLVARGRWSRWALATLGVGWPVVAVRTALDPASIAIVLGGAAMVGLATGPWLPRWLRHRPAAEGPPPAAVVLLLTLLWVPVMIAVTAPDPGATEVGAAIWALALAAGLARAIPAALWTGRFGHAPVILAAGAATGPPAGLGLAAVGLVQTVLLWRRDIHLSVSPLLPEQASGVPIPPELVDPAILRAAGRDERGARLEES